MFLGVLFYCTFDCPWRDYKYDLQGESKNMLIYDQITIGNKLLDVRKKSGLTQAEVAERADISDRAYADIERGCTNMRVDTLQKICNALHSTIHLKFCDCLL